MEIGFNRYGDILDELIFGKEEIIQYAIHVLRSLPGDMPKNQNGLFPLEVLDRYKKTALDDYILKVNEFFRTDKFLDNMIEPVIASEDGSLIVHLFYNERGVREKVYSVQCLLRDGIVIHDYSLDSLSLDVASHDSFISTIIANNNGKIYLPDTVVLNRHMLWVGEKTDRFPDSINNNITEYFGGPLDLVQYGYEYCNDPIFFDISHLNNGRTIIANDGVYSLTKLPGELRHRLSINYIERPTDRYVSLEYERSRNTPVYGIIKQNITTIISGDFIRKGVEYRVVSGGDLGIGTLTL